VSNPEIALLALAGVGAGLSGSIAGLASLISYPALLAVGLPPVTANVTNTVSLVFNSVGSILGSQPELRGQRPRLRRLGIAAVLGGAVGGVLLLVTPSDTFELIVPWLIGLASIAIVVRRGQQDLPPSRHSGDPLGLTVAVFFVAIYGGYFGAAAGVLLLALLLHSTSETLARSNAAKNVVLGIANSVAAVAFVVFGPVRWSAAVPLACGLLIGGRVGPVIVRHSPATFLRAVIAGLGVGLAICLGVRAYF
jgi:uncharacterized membrane protein YfcA